MKKQSIANRKSLEKIKEQEPERYNEIIRYRRVSSALSVLRLKATKEELQQASEQIKKVVTFLDENKNLSEQQLNELRAQTFGKRKGRPKKEK